MPIAPRQLQAKYKHASDFGIVGPYDASNARAFAAAIRAHVVAPNTEVIRGTFRGVVPVVFYVDRGTRLMVMTDAAGAFLSGWMLTPLQARHVLATGTL